MISSVWCFANEVSKQFWSPLIWMQQWFLQKKFAKVWRKFPQQIHSLRCDTRPSVQTLSFILIFTKPSAQDKTMQIGCGLFGVLKLRSKYNRLMYGGFWERLCSLTPAFCAACTCRQNLILSVFGAGCCPARRRCRNGISHRHGHLRNCPRARGVGNSSGRYNTIVRLRCVRIGERASNAIRRSTTAGCRGWYIATESNSQPKKTSFLGSRYSWSMHTKHDHTEVQRRISLFGSVLLVSRIRS